MPTKPDTGRPNAEVQISGEQRSLRYDVCGLLHEGTRRPLSGSWQVNCPGAGKRRTAVIAIRRNQIRCAADRLTSLFVRKT